MAGDGERNPARVATADDASINVNQLWQTVLADLETRISRGAFDNWFRQTSLAGVDDDVAIVVAPHAFSASSCWGESSMAKVRPDSNGKHNTVGWQNR